MLHPWPDLHALSHVHLIWRELPVGVWGLTDGASRIWLDPRLGQVEARCTLAHELEHLRRGHDTCQPAAVERAVEAAAARSLLPDLHAVADALAWADGDVRAAAEELHVDEITLATRLDERHLHPCERGLLDARRRQHEEHP